MMVLRIGALAKQTGLATSALRYYEEAGLLEPAARTEAGYRVYADQALGRVAFIRRAQSLGLSVKEIRELIASREDPDIDRVRLRHVVAHKLAATERRMAELEHLKDELQGMYVRLLRDPAIACGHLGDCACWLPTAEEVNSMATDVKAIEQCGCGDCPVPGCDCDCDCCVGA
jgi:DNA-binding transcriptional MerR regulator